MVQKCKKQTTARDSKWQKSNSEGTGWQVFPVDRFNLRCCIMLLLLNRDLIYLKCRMANGQGRGQTNTGTADMADEL